MARYYLNHMQAIFLLQLPRCTLHTNAHTIRLLNNVTSSSGKLCMCPFTVLNLKANLFEVGESKY